MSIQRYLSETEYRDGASCAVCVIGQALRVRVPASLCGLHLQTSHHPTLWLVDATWWRPGPRLIGEVDGCRRLGGRDTSGPGLTTSASVSRCASDFRRHDCMACAPRCPRQNRLNHRKAQQAPRSDTGPPLERCVTARSRSRVIAATIGVGWHKSAVVVVVSFWKSVDP